jgi:hypothetical protein
MARTNPAGRGGARQKGWRDYRWLSMMADISSTESAPEYLLPLMKNVGVESTPKLSCPAPSPP